LNGLQAVLAEANALQAEVAIADAATGKPISRIDGATPDEALIGLTVS